MNPIMDFRLKLEIELSEKSENTRGITIADKYGDISYGLDMEAHIIKSFYNTPKASTLKIYNLSSETYNLIYEKANAFRLSCARGEQADYVPFYTGFPLRASKIGKETVLTSNKGFMAQDANAGRAGQNDLETQITLINYGFAELTKSYQSSVTADLVIQDCINAIGMPRGNIDKNIEKSIKETIFPAGFTIRGDVQKTLTMIGNRCGFNWNTNDMQLNMYDKNCKDIKTYGILLTPDNSSTPERQNDKFKTRTKVIQKANKKKGIKGVKSVKVEKAEMGYCIKTQLLPYLACGSTCFLSEDFGLSGAEGSKYVYQIEHFVNNTGLEAYSLVYCV